MINVGINGLGRIGRAIFKILDKIDDMNVVCINDIDPTVKNHAYLINHDSIYGNLSKKIDHDESSGSLVLDNKKIPLYSKKRIEDVLWDGVDVVIDSSGIYDNVLGARKVVENYQNKVIVTHSPKDNIDFTMIIAANEERYNHANDNVVSSSICDANACAPVLKVLEDEIGIENGFITTLHPWLGYQNLVDGSIKSVSSPGHYWDDYALGRSSLNNLIPKKTTLMPAVKMALPELKKNISAMSFRVPTSIVSASDMFLNINKAINKTDLANVFKEFEIKYPNVILTNEESLVSIDFKGIKQSCVIDLRWLEIIDKKILKMVLWYDNEWGYANRAVDVARTVLKN